MELKKIHIDKIKPYKNNARKNDMAVGVVVKSIEQCEYIAPIILDENNVILAGHTRYKALKKLGYSEVECIFKIGLTEEQKKKYRLLDNKTAEIAEWDFSLLAEEIEGLDFGDLELDWGLEALDDIDKENDNAKNNLSLPERFIIPPFSIFDTRQGYWQERKSEWINLGIDSGVGRKDNLLGDGLKNLAEKNSKNTRLKGTSIFDPVLCEVIYRWFCIDNGNIFDPFSGGSVRGIVAEKLGYNYTGIDLRKEQIEANCENAKLLGVNPTWHCDDSLNLDKYIEDSSMDLIMSCPPYFDLEKYSDDERDISNMDYDKFLDVYSKIINKCCKKLKDDSFAVFVVGEVRDKKGVYRNFVNKTKDFFINNGLAFYNDIILIEPVVTGAIRCARSFNHSRKVTKLHQNVLVFFKGNIENIKNKFLSIESEETIKELLEEY